METEEIQRILAPFGVTFQQITAFHDTSHSKTDRRLNHRLWKEIQKEFEKFPRCVCQGDLNPTNYLQKDGHFAGLIDFNLSDTEGLIVTI